MAFGKNRASVDAGGPVLRAGSVVPQGRGNKPPVCARRARTVPREVSQGQQGGSSSAGRLPCCSSLFYHGGYAPGNEKPGSVFVVLGVICS